uniref:Apple domain-containing protein n=1 Tax=Oxyrrhis marina TaxID=2969 RepID=A0A7S4LPI6_OXYMA|mmetsp:Transcript_30125/g.77700  ORF Transcript_30125/g.77700 Transcript_30125/m.77700 type:complete len:702 (-) Transcript_30125:68-2173(-)
MRVVASVVALVLGVKLTEEEAASSLVEAGAMDQNCAEPEVRDRAICKEYSWKYGGYVSSDCHNNSFWGYSCVLECNSACKWGCDFAGNCLLDFCPENCKQQKRDKDLRNWVAHRNGDESCLNERGECEACDRGKWGLYCEHECSPKCKHTPEGQCDRNGACFGACESGFYGPQCTLLCPAGCPDCLKVDKIINGTLFPAGACPTPCTENYWGVSCSDPCPEHCSKGTTPSCKREDGTCYTCERGWWGPKCTNKCAEGCVDNLCDMQDGRCQRGCNPGWWGDACTSPCPGKSEGRCERKDGYPSECLAGFFPARQGQDNAEECFIPEKQYSPVNMRGQYRTIEKTARACQQRCYTTPGCAHFTFWEDGGCHLQDARAKLYPTAGAIAGPNVPCGDGLGECRQCSSKCFHGACDRYGKCMLCALGTWGDECENECPKGCVVGCSKEAGVCRDDVEVVVKDAGTLAAVAGQLRQGYTTEKDIMIDDVKLPAGAELQLENDLAGKSKADLPRLDLSNGARLKFKIVPCEPGFTGAMCDIPCHHTCSTCSQFAYGSSTEPGDGPNDCMACPVAEPSMLGDVIPGPCICIEHASRRAFDQKCHCDPSTHARRQAKFDKGPPHKACRYPCRRGTTESFGLDKTSVCIPNSLVKAIYIQEETIRAKTESDLNCDTGPDGVPEIEVMSGDGASECIRKDYIDALLHTEPR